MGLQADRPFCLCLCLFSSMIVRPCSIKDGRSKNVPWLHGSHPSVWAQGFYADKFLDLHIQIISSVMDLTKISSHCGGPFRITTVAEYCTHMTKLYGYDRMTMV